MNEHVERNDHIASEIASAAGPGLNAGTPAGHVHDVIVVGGGPCGATAAHDLARQGYDVVLLDREGRIKPCGGAVPPRLIKDFEIPDELIVARAKSARIISPSNRTVDMPIDGGYVGMVDREHFDAWLRTRAEDAGATRYAGTFERFERRADGTAQIVFTPKQRRAPGDASPVRTGPATATLAARFVIAADGARSKVARQAMPKVGEPKCVFAYHEIISAPQSADCSDVLPANAGDGGDPATCAKSAAMHYEDTRCDVFYQGDLSPDFYAWVFPHGSTASIGVGSARKGFSLRQAVKRLRSDINMTDVETLRTEGAPIPMKPLPRWDNGRDVLLAGDAAGVVAPASGEGIYYAMLGGRMSADAVIKALSCADDVSRAQALASARKLYMKEHGRVFWALGLLQRFWYRNDKRRERFVTMCADPDVQRLTWQAYMNKELVRSDPLAHLRVFAKDVAHLLGMVSPWRTRKAS